MTEDISQVYENVDIKAWAQQIRENKIREFADAVEAKQKEGREYLATDTSEYTMGQIVDNMSKGMRIAGDLLRMELKLKKFKKA